MSYPAREPGGSSRVVLAVTLAAVFLAIIGASVGVVAGRHALLGRTTPLTDDGTSPQGGGHASSPAAPGGTVPAHHNSPTPARSSAPATAPITCPQPMVDAVGTRLTLVFYVETQGSEAWVCKTPAGDLWYKGHKKPNPEGRYPADDLVEGENALLLDTVETQQGGKLYIATATDPEGHTVRYLLTTASLRIEHGDGTTEDQPATRHWP